MFELDLTSGREVAASGETVFIDFDGGQVAVVLVGGEPMPILNLACRDLRLDWKSQYAKIKADPAICMVENTTQLPGDGQSRKVMTTDLDGFGLWLAKINANKVAPEARDLVITWQRKAARAIRERFFGPATSSSAVQPVSLPDRRALALMVIEAEDRADAEQARAELAEAKVSELEPKADLAETFLIADGTTRLVREVAKLLAMRELDLRRFLIDERLIFPKRAECGDISYDFYAQYAAHFVAKETVVNHTWGSCSHYTLRVTAQGLDLIRKRLGKLRAAS